MSLSRVMERPRASASKLRSASRWPWAARPVIGTPAASIEGAPRSLSINTRGLAREKRERYDSGARVEGYHSYLDRRQQARTAQKQAKQGDAHA